MDYVYADKPCLIVACARKLVDVPCEFFAVVEPPDRQAALALYDRHVCTVYRGRISSLSDD